MGDERTHALLVGLEEAFSPGRGEIHGLAGDIVARGDAEIAVQQISEILAVSGVDLVGPLPGDLQSYTPYVAGIMVDAKQPEAGKALIKFLTTPASVSVIKAKGLELPE
jgi:molybdate transport system substrate-binding protein